MGWCVGIGMAWVACGLAQAQEPHPLNSVSEKYAAPASSFDVQSSNATAPSAIKPPPPLPAPPKVPLVPIKEQGKTASTGNPGHEVTTYQDPGRPELPIHVYKRPLSEGETALPPLSQLNVLVLGTSADAQKALEYGLDKGTYVAKDGKPYDVIISPAPTGSVTDLVRARLENNSEEAASQHAAVMLAAMKKEFPGQDLKVKGLDMHSNGTSVATPLLSTGNLVAESIGAFGPAMGGDNWALKRLYELPEQKGTSVKVYADVRDIVATGTGSLAAGLGTIGVDAMGMEGAAKFAWLARAAAYKKEGFEINVIDSGDRKGWHPAEPHFLSTYLKAIKEGRVAAVPDYMLKFFGKDPKLAAAPYVGVEGGALQYYSPASLQPSEKAYAQASAAAGLLNSGSLPEEWLAKLRAEREKLKKAYEPVLNSLKNANDERAFWEQHWLDTTKASNDAAWDLIGIGLGGMGDRIEDALKGVAQGSEEYVRLLKLRDEIKATSSLLDARAIEELSKRPDDAEKTIEAMRMLAEKVLSDPAVAKKIGEGPGKVIGLAKSIIDSAYNILSEGIAIARISQLDKNDPRFLEAIDLLGDRMKKLVKALNQLEKLADMIVKGQVTPEQLMGVLDQETLKLLESLGALTGAPEIKPTANPEASNSAVSELHVKQEPLGEAVYYHGAPRSPLPGGLQESEFFFRLQTRRTGPGGGSGGRSGARRLAAPPSAQQARGAYTAARQTRNPSYAQASPPPDNALRRMYEQDRVQRQASAFRSWAGGSSMTSSRPCPVCGGKGKIDLSGRLQPMINQSQQMLNQSTRQLSMPITCPSGKHNHSYCIQANQYRQQAMQQANQARNMLSNMKTSFPCSGCGGSGQMKGR